MKNEIREMLVEHLNIELQSELFYLSISSQFKCFGFDGFSKWMKKQAKYKSERRMKLFDFIISELGSVYFEFIETPTISKHDSILDVFEDCYNHEREITNNIDRLILFVTERRYNRGIEYLQGFLTEQFEDEHYFCQMITKLTLIGNNRDILRDLDEMAGKD